MIRTALGTFDSIPNFSLFHSSHGNSAIFQLLHGMLEWRWIYLSILYKNEYLQGKIGNEDSDLACEVKLLVYDLMLLSIVKYQKCNNANVIFTSPFICNCVKEMWNLIYEFIERLQDNSTNFWSLLTSNIFDNVKSNRNYYENFSSKKILLRSSQTITLRSNFDQFSIWLISGLIKLLESRESFEYYENVIKNYLKTDQSEENLRVLMILLSETILTAWSPKSEILLHLWEIFHKKINSPFLIAGQSPNFLQVSNNSAEAMIEQLKKQQTTPVNKLNANLSSYAVFVYSLGKMIEKFTQDNQKIQIQKIFGRILAKFPSGKLQQLNEMGIYNILKLLLTIAISTDFIDVSQKISHILLQIPLEKTNNQQQVLRGHFALIILYCENHQNITQYVTKLMNQVNAQLQKSNSLNILKAFAESLSLILRSEDIFENGEEILIDSWIVRHLQNCTTVEQDRLLESLNKIILKIREMDIQSLSAIVLKIFNLLHPFVKQNFGKSDSILLPDLAVNLCLLALDSQTFVDVPKFDVLFKNFADITSNNYEASMKFLTLMLKNSSSNSNLDVLIIMQNWIKYSVLLNRSNKELNEFTRQVMKMKEFQALCETSVKKPDEFAASKEPLVTFIVDIGRKYAVGSFTEKFSLTDRMHVFLIPFEKWALPILQQCSTHKIGILSPDESIMRIYTFIAITFLHCSELVYIQSKSSCFFNIAISFFILPSSLMTSQTPQQPRAVTVAIHKTFPLLIDGISKLSYKNDAHIAKVLSDVIIKWTPLLKLSNNTKFVAKPFISVSNLKNLEVVEFFWGKLTKTFIALQPGKKPNVNCNMVLTMIEETMHVVEGDELRVMAIWKNLMQHLIESAMLLDEIEPAQKTCFNLFERFLKNKNFESSSAMRELVSSSLKIIAESNLAYHSSAYFR